MSLKVDEMWSFVGNKKQPHWLWWVEDAVTSEIIAFVLGRRIHQTFRNLLSLLEQAKIEVIRWITDSWWAYFDCLDHDYVWSVKLPCRVWSVNILPFEPA